MILVPFFAVSTAFGFTKNLMSFPFQAPVFFALMDTKMGLFASLKKILNPSIEIPSYTPVLVVPGSPQVSSSKK